MESKSNDTEKEAIFRKHYAHHLRDKKQQVYNSHMGHNALEEERKQVNQQAMKTPGRRGEIIKNEEIDREISRRYGEHIKSKILYQRTLLMSCVSVLGDYALYDLIPMTDRGIPELMPIEKDEKKGDRQYFCIGCGSTATKTAHFKTPGAIMVERYCEPYASKLR